MNGKTAPLVIVKLMNLIFDLKYILCNEHMLNTNVPYVINQPRHVVLYVEIPSTAINSIKNNIGIWDITQNVRNNF